jgi:hypothetical protein
MIGSIGDFSQQYTLRINYFTNLRDQLRIVDELKQTGEIRKIERTNHSMQSNINFQHNKSEKTKNVFEDGKLVVERYDKNGKLIRKTPPGFIPFNQNVTSIFI